MAEPNIWDRLSESSKRAFAWAAANESNQPVRSDYLLLGIFRAHPAASEPQQLLEHFAYSVTDIEYFLHGIDVGASRARNSPLDLDGLPSVSDDVQEILERSLQLAEEHNPETPTLVRLRDLFGGILFTQNPSRSRHWPAP